MKVTEEGKERRRENRQQDTKGRHERVREPQRRGRDGVTQVKREGDILKPRGRAEADPHRLRTPESWRETHPKGGETFRETAWRET